MNIEMILIIIGIFCLFIIFFVLVKSKKSKISKSDRKKISREFKKYIQLKPEEAIIKFDKLLDFALGKLGKQGTLGEKLKDSQRTIKNLNGIWRAHKLRNKIAHEIDFQFSKRDFKDAVSQYKKALQELGIKL